MKRYTIEIDRCGHCPNAQDDYGTFMEYCFEIDSKVEYESLHKGCTLEDFDE